MTQITILNESDGEICKMPTDNFKNVLICHSIEQCIRLLSEYETNN